MSRAQDARKEKINKSMMDGLQYEARHTETWQKKRTGTRRGGQEPTRACVGMRGRVLTKDGFSEGPGKRVTEVAKFTHLQGESLLGCWRPAARENGMFGGRDIQAQGVRATRERYSAVGVLALGRESSAR